MYEYIKSRLLFPQAKGGCYISFPVSLCLIPLRQSLQIWVSGSWSKVWTKCVFLPQIVLWLQVCIDTYSFLHEFWGFEHRSICWCITWFCTVKSYHQFHLFHFFCLYLAIKLPLLLTQLNNLAKLNCHLNMLEFRFVPHRILRLLETQIQLYYLTFHCFTLCQECRDWCSLNKLILKLK